MPLPALALLLALGASASRADEYTLLPVEASLRVEPDRVVVDLDSDSIYWIEEVIEDERVPPNHWPAQDLRRAEDYVNKHLRLSVDGRPLTGRLVDARYVQGLGEVNEQGRVRLRLAYGPVEDGAVLSGEADFFEEFRRERLGGSGRLLPSMVFQTSLDVPGRVPRRFTLTPGATAFSLPVAEARRGPWARAIESLRAGAGRVLDTGAAWPALLALALCLGPRPSRARLGAGLLAMAVGAAASAPAPGRLVWAAGVAASVGAGRWLGEKATPYLEAAALVALARVWAAAAWEWLPRAAPGPAELGLAVVGVLAAAALALSAGVVAARVERRRLESVSQSRAAELFERRRRLSATALLIVCGYGLLGAR